MNEENFQMLMHFINERHSIYLNRMSGKPKPWSEDPIFQEWKFCNVFRYLDKQTVNLMQHIDDHGGDTKYDILFNIFQFRAFNLNETYNLLSWHNSSNPWDTEQAQRLLKLKSDSSFPITSGAYMIRGYLGQPKWFSIPRILEQIWDKREALMRMIEFTGAPKLETICNTLTDQKFWGWGPFTCYQVTLDIVEAGILENDPEDLNTWTFMGPGAEKGFALLFPDKKITDWPEVLPGLLKEVNSWENKVPNLNLQDLEFCLCELQKYHRIANGGRGKERYNARG